MTEVRGRQGVCSGSCSSYGCIKGSKRQGNSLQTDGCPMQYHSAQLTDNATCVMCEGRGARRQRRECAATSGAMSFSFACCPARLGAHHPLLCARNLPLPACPRCMSCLKACPNGSVELRLRPPGIDLWTTHVPSIHEASLMFLLLGAAFLHRWAAPARAARCLPRNLGCMACCLQPARPLTLLGSLKPACHTPAPRQAAPARRPARLRPRRPGGPPHPRACVPCRAGRAGRARVGRRRGQQGRATRR
jgi:hypothetical protein